MVQKKLKSKEDKGELEAGSPEVTVKSKQLSGSMYGNYRLDCCRGSKGWQRLEAYLTDQEAGVV